MTDPNENPHPDYDITDTQKFRLDLWQRVVQLENKFNGISPKECRTEVMGHIRYIKYGLYLLGIGVLTLFSALYVLK